MNVCARRQAINVPNSHFSTVFLVASLLMLGTLLGASWGFFSVASAGLGQQSCEALHQDQTQCVHSKTNAFSTLCMWCAQEASCLGVACGSSFSSDFMARCGGSINFIDNCDVQPEIRLMWDFVVWFAMLNSVHAIWSAVDTPKEGKLWQKAVLALVGVAALAGTLGIWVSNLGQLGLFVPTLFLAASPSAVSLPYLLHFASSLIELRVGLCRLLVVLLAGSLATLQIVRADIARSWLVIVALCLSTLFCHALMWAHSLRERALNFLDCLPATSSSSSLPLTKRDYLLLLVWFATLVGAIFWYNMHRFYAALHVFVVVLMQILFLKRHEGVRSFAAYDHVKALMTIAFCAQVFVLVLLLALEPAASSPGTLDLLAVLSFVLGLQVCACFVWRMQDKGFYAEHFRARNKRLLSQLLLPDVAGLVEAYAFEPFAEEEDNDLLLLGV